jgi:hypothetical protein
MPMQSGNLPPMFYFWLAAAVCAAVALWALHRFLLCLHRDRLLADTPLVKIRSAAQGYVKLFGRAAPNGDGLSAPLSSRPCVWWRYQVEEKCRGEKGQTHWEIIDSGTSVDLFSLVDGDAQCLVGPINAEITPTTHQVWYGATPRPGAAPAQKSGFLNSGDFRYTESSLSIGDKLSVLGELRSHGELSDANQSAAALLSQWKHDQKTLLARFDRNRDGKLDDAEWDAARQAAAAESRSTTQDSRLDRMSIISEPTNGEPFLIAAMDDAHLVHREKLHALGFFGLGLVCVTGCAWAAEHALAPQAATGSSGGIGAPIFGWVLYVVGVSIASYAARRWKATH